MNKAWDVVGIGAAAMDFISLVDRLPTPDGFAPLLDMSWQGGGKVPTAMAAAGCLGLKAAIFCNVGEDAYGKANIDDFQYNGVDTRYVKMVAGCDTNFCICLAAKEKKTRCYIGKLGSVPEVAPEDLDREMIQNARYVHLSGITPASLQAAEWARQAGGLVVMDADRYDQDIRDHLDVIDVLIGSQYFHEGIFGPLDENRLESDLRAMREMGPPIVITTRGAKGCAGCDANGYFRLNAYTNVEIVDTTGAGDVFHGAYIAALCRGLDAREAAKFASAASAVKCTEIGGRAGIPNLETLELFLETGKIDRTIFIAERVEHYRSGIKG